MPVDLSANTKAAVTVLRSLLSDLESGVLHVESLESKDSETVVVRVECALASRPPAKEDPPVPQPLSSCPKCGAHEGIVEGGKNGTKLDLLCIGCQHVWQVNPPED